MLFCIFLTKWKVLSLNFVFRNVGLLTKSTYLKGFKCSTESGLILIMAFEFKTFNLMGLVLVTNLILCSNLI